MTSSVAALGGALMVLSIFFRLSYGPMGGEISYYSLISHNFSWGGWPMLLIAWPVAFGTLEVVFGLARLNERSLAAANKWHTIAAGMLLVSVAGLQLLMSARQARIEYLLSGDVLTRLVLLAAVPIAVGLVFTLKWTLRKRLHWLRIIGATWILMGLFPVSQSVPLAEVLSVYGIGYWMMVAGTLILAIVSLAYLARTDSGPQSAITADLPAR